MKDGDLRPLFRDKFPKFQWTSVETAGTASGVPDSEYCTPSGIQGWIEFKSTKIYHVAIRPLQVAWLMRRCRYGGNAFIVVRRQPSAAKHAGADELWIMRGDQAEALFNGGLNSVYATCWDGGPKNWSYEGIADILNNVKQP